MTRALVAASAALISCHVRRKGRMLIPSRCFHIADPLNPNIVSSSPQFADIKSRAASKQRGEALPQVMTVLLQNIHGRHQSRKPEPGHDEPPPPL
jgi:hypothetical protein